MHYCVVPGCNKSSTTHPNLSFHRLPLKNKHLLKIWVHKVGRKNLPLNCHSRVCSDHFINSVGRLLRNDEFPTENLPILPTRVTSKPRKSPKERYSTSHCESVSDFEADTSIHTPPSTLLDASMNTVLTGIDIQSLKAEVVHLKHEVDCLKSKVTSSKFCLSNVASRNMVSYYTGFPSIETLNACYEYLGPAVDNLTYWNGGKSKSEDDTKGKGRPRALQSTEEFFLLLVRLRLGLLEQDLADRFEISCATVSRIFATWINFLYFKFKQFSLWPPQEVVRSNMPNLFKDKYPATRVILDATEIFVEKPSMPDIQQLTFSTYKNNNTFKVLVGISPSGAITFVSDLYPGSISDRKLTQISGIFSLLEKGDSVMADRGFDIQDDLTPLGVKLNIPPFLRGKSQLDFNEMIETRRIASARIHVERAMERIKNFHIFDKPLSSSLTDLANQIFYVCAILSNFWPPLCN